MKWLPSWRFLLGSFLSFIALIAGLVIFAYIQVDIPDPEEFAQAQTSTVYYSDGETEMGRFAVQDRIIVDISQIPEHARNAVVAAEDRSFYDNAGIDPKGIARAFVGNIKGGRTTGGSTITQQYAERYYMGTTKDYVGKFKEALLAIKLDRSQDKEEILGNYLNTIYFGRGAYGIEMAARQYFGISAKDLNVSQAALIAGLIPAPSAWDPRVSPDDAQRRWNYVLKNMVEDGWLTQAERDTLTFPETIEYSPENRLAGPQGYLLNMVKSELEVAGLTEDDLNTKGLTVITTIDKTAQEQAVQTLSNLPQGASANLQPSLVTLDSQTGGIVALYGGPDFVTRPFNSATQGIAQAGSTFKPFALVAALENGVKLTNTFNGSSPRTFNYNGENVKIQNFGNVSYGRINLEKATANSVNTAFIELNQNIGPKNTMEVAVRAGIPEDSTDLRPVLSNVLGSASVHPIDMASAYSTFSAQGLYRKPHIIDRIVDAAGDVQYEAKNEGKRVFAEDVMAETTYAMTKVVEYGSADKAQSLNVPIAGKTGTSNDNKSAWFVGFTTRYTTAVALYQSGEGGVQESIAPFGGYKEITGSSVPLDLWVSYMGQFLAGKPVENFPDRPKSIKLKNATKSASPSATTTAKPTPSETEPEEEETTPPAQVSVPASLTGSSEATAIALLQGNGLKANVVYSQSDVPAGVVLSISPASGQKVSAGSTVTLTVSSGRPTPSATPTPTPMPSTTTKSPAPIESTVVPSVVPSVPPNINED